MEDIWSQLLLIGNTEEKWANVKILGQRLFSHKSNDFYDRESVTSLASWGLTNPEISKNILERHWKNFKSRSGINYYFIIIAEDYNLIKTHLSQQYLLMWLKIFYLKLLYNKCRVKKLHKNQFIYWVWKMKKKYVLAWLLILIFLITIAVVIFFVSTYNQLLNTYF